MQGKLIAVAYTLRTYWNQFSLGGICKQELMHHNFENSHNSFLRPEHFIHYFCENWFHVRLWHPSCVYITAQRQYTAVHLWNNFPCIITLTHTDYKKQKGTEHQINLGRLYDWSLLYAESIIAWSNQVSVMRLVSILNQ